MLYHLNSLDTDMLPDKVFPDQKQPARRRVRFRDLSPCSISSSDSRPLSDKNMTLASSRNARWQKTDGRRLDSLGIAPVDIVGKRLVNIHRVHPHPKLALYFDDGSIYEVRVDTHNSRYPGIPREIAVDHDLDDMIGVFGDGRQFTRRCTIENATLLTMQDHSFHVTNSGEVIEWVKRHIAVAFRFEEDGHWHYISVTFANYDNHGKCIFRSFDDVYLHRIERPTTRKQDRGSRITYKCKDPRF